MEMHPAFGFVDPYIIWWFRLSGYAPVDFLIGTFVLALLAVILGEASVWLVLLVARRPFTKVATEAQKYQNLSMEALAAGDRPSYEAANKLANDAFGQSFFKQIALSGAFLWPACIALAWMGYRFAAVAFPLPVIRVSLGYAGIFILLYIAAYFLFKRVKARLPYCRRPLEVSAPRPATADADGAERS